MATSNSLPHVNNLKSFCGLYHITKVGLTTEKTKSLPLLKESQGEVQGISTHFETLPAAVSIILFL